MIINIKRTAALLSALCMVLALCSCGGRINRETTAPVTTSGTESNVVRVTFPEGFTAQEIAKRLEENGVCSAAEFLQAADDPSYLEGTGFEIESPADRAFALEGYLFPDTYDFYYGENVASVIKKFIRNFTSKFTDSMLQRADELGYSADEIITIASIIQEEAGHEPDMPGVSSVLHNRLESPDFPKLQCDACSFYLRDSVKPYVSEDEYEKLLQTYSTYNCNGLPEGPITNPGAAAINAALYPPQTDYYYFLTDSEGVYHYAETFSEHQENYRLAGI